MQSITRQLLSIPSIIAGGIEHSVVFYQLPDGAKQAILQAKTEEEKIAIAALAGDDLPVIKEMHQHYVVDAQVRAERGEPSDFEKFLLSGLQ